MTALSHAIGCAMLLSWIAVAQAGWSFAPLPILDYSSDHGFGYGGVAQAVWRPIEEEPPKLTVGVQLMWTTRAYRDHWLKLDWRINDTWRVEGVGGFRAWDYAPYFGEGHAPIELDPEETRYAYCITGARVLLNVRRRLSGPFEFFATGFLRTAEINAWPGSVLEDQGSFEDGRYLSLAAGLLVDSRDALPSPTAGHLAELSVRASHPWLGSEFAGGGVNLTERVYLSRSEALVWASKATLDLRWGETPFFASHILGGSQWTALGGPWMLRGYPEGRFRGDGALLVSTELRWTVHTLHLRGHSVGLMPTPFVDAGRVWQWDKRQVSALPAVNGGLGARFVWDEDIVLRIDTAVGVERLETGQLGPSFGIWTMMDHPF